MDKSQIQQSVVFASEEQVLEGNINAAMQFMGKTRAEAKKWRMK